MSRVLALLFAVLANAQTIGLTTASDDARPVDTIVGQLERLSGIPISYEDLLYANPSDTVDIGSSVAKTPGAHVIVPRGGALSVSITADPVTQKLADRLATSAALNALLAAAGSSPVIAGRFRLDSYNNAFFVVPTHSRAPNNDMAPFAAPLSTPVDLSVARQSAFEALRSILDQISQKSGVTVKIGTIPVMAFAVTHVALAASNQPARYALANLFNAVCTSREASPGFWGMSYHAYFDPIAKYYALNIHAITRRNPPAPSSEPLPPAPAAGSPLGRDTRWLARD